MNFYKSAFIMLLFSLTAYAKLPIAPCHSYAICKKALPSGAHYVHIGNQLMYYRLIGKGKRTIVLSSGTGFPADGWSGSGLAKSFSKYGRVFMYDRLYTFNSCPNKNNYMPNTGKDVVARMRLLLLKAHLRPSYILVGQSFGGLYD